MQEAKPNVDEWKLLLKSVSRPELQSRYVREIADLLYSLVRDNDSASALMVLEEAGTIAFNLWRTLSSEDEGGVETDWLTKAINHPAGILVEFWIKALSHTLSSKAPSERRLADDYRELFTSAIQDKTVAGGMGRAVLVGQVAFLFRLDESWTREYIIPLFTSTDSVKCKQAWDGFLIWGQLYDVLADALKPAFLSAATRLNTDIIKNRRRFIELFTALAVFTVNDPTSDLLPALLQHGSVEDRNTFAYHLGVFLGNMSPAMRQSLWERWVYRYWKNRLTSTSVPLAEAEMKTMLDWLPRLGELFPAGVSLAISGSLGHLDHCSLIHEMRESDLVIQFPDDTAELLIYLAPLLRRYHQADVLAIVDSLPVLEPHLKCKLDESLARAGFK